MKVLITGSNGFVAKNLISNLRLNEEIEIFEYNRNSSLEDLKKYTKDCDFVYHLAGVNRPKDVSEFMEGNYDFTNLLLSCLKENNNKCPIMISSSTQAELDNDYGKSKRAGEQLVFAYGKENNVKTFVYRFPNLFGKWCRPNYNSVIATWCYNIANGLDITVNDENKELTLCYIDDVVCELLDLLEGKEHRNGDYCYVPIMHKVTLVKIVELLNKFKNQANTLIIPEIPNNSFEKKLYSTYLSYLPEDKVKFELKMKIDDRGSFTELLKTENCGQFSVNISKPGIIKGQHWHHSKWEFFMVVSGHALIQERQVGTDKILEFEVSGDKHEAIHMLPGYTHNIINLSSTENLITVMWANEIFDNNHPDTYFEEV